MNSSAPLATTLLAALAIAATAAGCSSSTDSDDAPESDQGALETTCAAPAVPRSLDELEKYSSCELKSLFESEQAKALTSRASLPKGAFRGVPLCRKVDIQGVLKRPGTVPANVRKLGGIAALGALAVSDTFSNTVAGEIWHGKHFTPDGVDGAILGDVNNYIDITARDIGDDVHRSAEARYFIDPDKKWLVLDYSKAATGLRVLKTLTVELVRQVYDTARLVDAERGLWVGMAYFVNDLTGEIPEGATPEEARAVSTHRFAPEKANNVVPSCYFALQRDPASDR